MAFPYGLVFSEFLGWDMIVSKVIISKIIHCVFEPYVTKPDLIKGLETVFHFDK